MAKKLERILAFKKNQRMKHSEEGLKISIDNRRVDSHFALHQTANNCGNHLRGGHCTHSLIAAHQYFLDRGDFLQVFTYWKIESCKKKAK